MEQFNLEKWLKNKSRKIVTRDGIEAEIIHDKYPLVAIINGVAYNFDNDGRFKSNRAKHPYNLFFADEEEELTKFEKEIQIIISDASHWTSDDGSISTYCLFGDKEIKKISTQILDLARKELEKDIYDNGYRIGYEIGKEEALKDLPKWKKNKLPNSESYMGFTGSYFCYRGYNINYDELFEKLPKEK